MQDLVIGRGEVGQATAEVLSKNGSIYVKDLGNVYSFFKNGKHLSYRKPPKSVFALHICMNFSDRWMADCVEYAKQFSPKVINNQTTCPPGTTQALQAATSIHCVHSTTRGLHPNLAKSIQTFEKFVGHDDIDQGLLSQLLGIFKEAGIPVRPIKNSRTTELAHIMSNALYGVNIMFAAEMDKLCRQYGVDYSRAVIAYNETSNEGYDKLGHPSKMRFILTPPGDRVGGHCIVHGAGLIPQENRGAMLDALAKFNDKK